MYPPARALRGYVAPLLLVLVAAHQYYRVHSANWNSWRGGGFGMYAGFHPAHSEAWLWRDNDEPPIRVERLREGEPDTLGIQDCLVRVNAGCLSQAVHRMPRGAEVRRIEIWGLSFDSSSTVLRRERLVEFVPGSDR